MIIWHKLVRDKLLASRLFRDVNLVGAKVRATLDEVQFLDIHYDPTTGSYSYALIDLRLPFPGDKRLFGWDDYPHEGGPEMKALPSHPHHFQRRTANGRWLFEPSPMRGDVEKEMDIVVNVLQAYLARERSEG